MITNGHDIQKHGEFPNGTSLQGYVTTTYDTLKRVFGTPHCFDGDKTNVEWVLLIDGVVVTIHDWKETRIILGEYQWHIGGHSTEAVGLVQSVVEGDALRIAARTALGYIRDLPLSRGNGSTPRDIAIRQLEKALGEAVTSPLVTAEEEEAPIVMAVGKREAGTWTVKRTESKG